MKVIVSYDVSTITPAGRARLRKVARVCKSFGVRVQLSVFECSVTDRELPVLRQRVLDAVKIEEDSLRIFYLSEDDARKTEHHGVREPVDPDGLLVV